MFGRAAVAVLFSISLASSVAAQQVILGILEEVSGESTGGPNSYAVRSVFLKGSAGWQAYPSNCRNPQCLKTISSKFPAKTLWTITFDGKSLGHLTAQTPREFQFYADVGLQKITSTGSIPSVGKPSVDFGGFDAAPVHRPLVANSQPYFRDPDVWKPTQPSPVLLGLLRQQFRKKFPKLCRISKHDESTLEPFVYGDEDVRLAKAYASKNGWLVARLHLSEAVDCSDTEAGFEIDDPWFTIDPEKSPRYLDSGMWLVDAGDYDNDGRSELVFSISRYNRGGYLLFYDDFSRHAAFEFSYH